MDGSAAAADAHDDKPGQPMRRGLPHKRWYHVIDREDAALLAAGHPEGDATGAAETGVDLRQVRLRYIWTENRWYRDLLLLLFMAAFGATVVKQSLKGAGVRDQVDLCAEGLLTCPDSWASAQQGPLTWPADDDQTLNLRVQGCAITWTPAWFNTCNRTSNDRPEGTDLGAQVKSYHQSCEKHNTRHSYRKWWKGLYYTPQAESSVPLPFKLFNSRTWFESLEVDQWGVHEYCPYCVGIFARSSKTEFESATIPGTVAWKVISDGTTRGPTLVIGPTDQPQNPDVFGAPPICYVSIPTPPPRNLNIEIGGDHVFKSRVYAANQGPGENPRVVNIQSQMQSTPVLVDFHDVDLDHFSLGGTFDATDTGGLRPRPGEEGRTPTARVHMTNVSIAKLYVSIDTGYADISTPHATVVTHLDRGSVCVAGGAVSTLGESITLATSTNQRPVASLSDEQQFFIEILTGDASVNVWADPDDETGKYAFDVYDRPRNSSTVRTGIGRTQRALSFDPAELQAVAEATSDTMLDILDVRVSGPGYLAMDTAYNKYFSQDGYLADLLFSHDMPMRTGPWGFTRRPPINWHTSQIEVAAFSAGTMAARNRDGEPGTEMYDLTMLHGFCPTFHKKGTVCTERNDGDSSVLTKVQSCESEYSDFLLERDHRYSCDPSWGQGIFSSLWFLRPEFNCKTPFETDSPYSFDRDFVVDLKVYSAMRDAGIPSAPDDPIIMQWGLSWDTIQWCFFHYDSSSGDSSIESTQNVKLLSSWMMLLMWYGAGLIVILFALTVHRFFRDSVAQFKLEMLMMDARTRSFVAKILPAMEVDRLDRDCNGHIDHEEVARYKRYRVQDLISHEFVSDLEMFIYRQLLQHNLGLEPTRGITGRVMCHAGHLAYQRDKGATFCSMLFKGCFGRCCGLCCKKRIGADKREFSEIRIHVNVTDAAREELEQISGLMDAAGRKDFIEGFTLPAKEVLTCLHRLRLLTTYVGLAHILENIVPNKLPYDLHPDIPQALHFQSTHTPRGERNVILLQATWIFLPAMIIAVMALGVVKFQSAFSFNMSDQFALFFQKWVIWPAFCAWVYFCVYNVSSTGYANPGCAGWIAKKCGQSSHSTEDEIDVQIDQTTMRDRVIKSRLWHFISNFLQFAVLVVVFMASTCVVIFAELTLLGMFLYPARCLPFAATFGGLGINVVTLKSKLNRWMQRVEDEVQEAMECVQDVVSGMREAGIAAEAMRKELLSLPSDGLRTRAQQMGLHPRHSDGDGSASPKTDTELIDEIVSHAHGPAATSAGPMESVHRVLQEIQHQQAISPDFELIRSFQRKPVAIEHVADLLRQFGLTRTVIVSTTLSATVALALVCGFLILAHQVATNGTSESASAITSVLIAASVAGSNRLNDPSTSERDFQQLKKKIVKFYYEQQTKAAKSNFVFSIGGDALQTLEAASDHYEALQATRSKSSSVVSIGTEATVGEATARSRSNESTESPFDILPGSVATGE